MGWGLFKKNKKEEKAVVPQKGKTIGVDIQKLADLKHKAAEYDRLTTGENGTFLRRNGIIK